MIDPSEKILGFFMSKMSEEEINLILQNPENLSYVIVNRLIKFLNERTKPGQDAIYRIGYKGSRILRESYKARNRKTLFFKHNEEKSIKRRNRESSKTR